MKAIIVGGGIAGLSTAWFLKKRWPEIQITLLEREERLGGWIQTCRDHGILFEKGPRTFSIGRSPELLSLIQELGLPILYSDSKAKKRFLYFQGKLRSPFLLRWIFPILKEPFVKKGSLDDESIYDFATRRFSESMAELLFDPMTLGIYAGDAKQLSIRRSFPTLYEWEKTKGSVLLGLLFSKKRAPGLFTLKEGMESLIEALKERLSIEIQCNTEVDHISSHAVMSKGRCWQGDCIFDARPPPLLKQSIWVVHLAYDQDLIRHKGYGYLVPSIEKEQVLGAIFDSCIFPSQNGGALTRITVMLRANVIDPVLSALDAMRRHLGIERQPLFTASFFAKEAIVQLGVGADFPYGVSVESAVAKAKHWVFPTSGK